MILHSIAMGRKRILDCKALVYTIGGLFLLAQELGNRRLYERYRKVYRLDRSFSFNGNGIKIYGGGRVVAGPGGYISQHSVLEAHRDCTIRIGRNCSIGDFVRISTSNRFPDQDFSREPHSIRTGNVTIGDYCWIGTHVYIKEGVTIGENSIIGANSVVTKDIPPFSIAAGAPCRVLRKKNLGRRALKP